MVGNPRISFANSEGSADRESSPRRVTASLRPDQVDLTAELGVSSSSVLDRQRHVGNMARPFLGPGVSATRRRGFPPRTQGVLNEFRFPTHPTLGSSVRGYFLVALGVLALGLGGGCEDKHIGRPCNTNVPDAGASGGQRRDPHVAQPRVPEPHLPPAGARGYRVRRRAGRRGGDVHGRLLDGRRLLRRRSRARTCKSGFVCTWPTTTGSFCCQKMCVCHDFVVVPPGGIPEPSTCLSPAERAEPADLPERSLSVPR